MVSFYEGADLDEVVREDAVAAPGSGAVDVGESEYLVDIGEAGTARIRSTTVSFARCRWWVSLSLDVHRTHRAVAACVDGVVGVDLGVAHLAVLSRPVPGVSDEQGLVANPDHLEHAQRSLRRRQRQAARRRGPDHRTNVTPSTRWRRTQADIARLHARVANARADGLHHLTTALT